MLKETNKNFLKIAIKAAKAAGKIQLKYFRKECGAKTKSVKHDLVTLADIESENIIRKIISRAFPNHNILGEESGLENKGSDYTWIADPLDGTNNFASGIAIFSCSIAIAYKGHPVVGVVYDPYHRDLYYATKNGGAFVNKKPLNVSNKGLDRSILVTGFYYDRGKDMRATLTNIQHFFEHGILGIRRLGSAALDLCQVAAGYYGGYWEYRLSPWDFAAGKLIVEEAGGMVTNQHGKDMVVTDPSFMVASNKKNHKAMLKIINRKK